MAQVKVSDIVAALEKDGFPWIKNHMSNGENGSCALGQISRNLFGTPAFGWYIVYGLDTLGNSYGIGHALVYKNDARSTKTYEEVVEYAKEILAPYMDRTIEVEGA